MENNDILRYGILAFFAALPICTTLYLLGQQKFAIGFLLLTIPFTLQGFALKLSGEFLEDLNIRLKEILK